jgi:GTP-binding protein EngB required for normal cell division
MKSRLTSNLSQYLWSPENPNRHGTTITVTYIDHEKSLATLDQNGFYYNMVIIDRPEGSHQAKCRLIRQKSSTAVIICVKEDDSDLRNDDDKCVEFADLMIAHPEVVKSDQWRDLSTLLVNRLESSDFLPSPLIQQYMTAL